MFNLRRQRRDDRQNQEQCTSPPPGTDSAYGVRSLNGSVSWSPGERTSTERGEEMETSRGSGGGTGGPSDVDGTNLISSEEGTKDTLDTDHTSSGAPLGASLRDRIDGEGDGDVDATPLPTTPGLPLLPDPFAPSPPPSPSSTPAAASPPTHPTSSPLRSSPIPVNGRIAHVGQGILWPPSSPDETLHPLSLSTSQGLASLVHPRPNLHSDAEGMYDDHDHLHRALSDLEHLGDMGGISGRSSPASFTSLPSYVGSMSSLSRASSPVSGISGAAISRETSYSAHHRFAGLHEREYEGDEAAGSRSEELVLPTLSLPSSSLHLSLPKWEGEVSGVKVVLLGAMDKAQEAIRALGAKLELVDVGEGVGIVKDGGVVLILNISPRTELVKRSVLGSYSALSRLLHPRPPKGSETQIRQLISVHAKRSSWIHLVYDTANDVEQTLGRLVPVVTPASRANGETTPVSNPGDAASPVLSPMDDPTPMPSTRSATSYFPTSPVEPEPTQQIAHDIIDLLSKLPEVESRSVDAYLAHRTRMTERATSSLEASITSADSSNPFSPHSAHSGTSSDPAPMPTVARVSGGGEWEAGLSRREALHLRRREWSERASRERWRSGRPTRRRACTPPLFPGSGQIGEIVSASVWRSIWSRLFGPWIPPVISDKPLDLELPESEKAAGTAPIDERPRKRWSALRWGLGAVVFVGVGLLLSKATITADIYIGTGVCC